MRVDSAASGRKGGIDFNSDKMNVETRMDSRFRGNDRGRGGNDTIDNGIKFSAVGGSAFGGNIDPAMLRQLQNASGFVPVIVHMECLTNLQDWLNY